MKPTPDPGFWGGVSWGAFFASLIWFAIVMLTGCTSGPPAEDNGAGDMTMPPGYEFVFEADSLGRKVGRMRRVGGGASVETLRVVGVREADQARQIAVRALSRDAPVDQIIQLSMLISEYPWIGELLDDRITQGVFLPGGPVFDFPADIELDWWNRISLERSGNTLVLRRRPTLNAITYDALLRAGEAEAAEKWKDEPRAWETDQ